MRSKDLHKLKRGDFINHKHFGLCIVDDFNQIGIVIRPLSVHGFMLLADSSRTLFNRFLEDSKRLILEKVENPILPKLLFKTTKGFDVHEWKKPGVVTPEGKFSSKKIKSFKTREEAFEFAKII